MFLIMKYKFHFALKMRCRGKTVKERNKKILTNCNALMQVCFEKAMQRRAIMVLRKAMPEYLSHVRVFEKFRNFTFVVTTLQFRVRAK